MKTPNTREYKGKSIIALPNDFSVIDIETTGLDYDYCHIIEVSALRVRDSVVVDRFSCLIQPPAYTFFDDDDVEYTEYVDSFITSLTGITNEMLENAPKSSDVIPQFLGFVKDDVLIGHHVSFDINFLYDASEELGFRFSNDFIDTLRISRKLYPDMAHHRLKDMAKLFEIDQQRAHRAESDCNTTFECYNRLKELALSKYSEEDFIKLFRPKSSYTRILDARDIKPESMEFDESNPLYNKVVVFTGALSNMSRKDAMQIVANLGGINANDVTKKTNYLVVGSGEFAASVKNGKTNKMRKADNWKLKGADISVISENVFFDMIQNQ